MEEVDILIKKMKDDQELKDYLNKNIYPKSLLEERSWKCSYLPKLKPFNSIEVDTIKIENNLYDTLHKLTQIENQIQNIIKIENKENLLSEIENNCPICLEKIPINNYLVPECGHKVCLKCFTKNIKHNSNTGNLCCLCRKNIIPQI